MSLTHRAALISPVSSPFAFLVQPDPLPKKQKCTSRVLPAGFTAAEGFLAFQFQEQPPKLALP